MCCVVDTPCLLVNAFMALDQKRSSISLQELHNAVQKVSASIAKHDAIVSWDRPHLQAALYNYHDLFRKTNQEVSKTTGSEMFFSKKYVDTVFNGSLNSDVVQAIQDTFKNQLIK